MKDNEALKLQRGDTVTHKRYGAALVSEVLACDGALFGVAISLTTKKGNELLEKDSGGPFGADFLEDNARNLSLPSA